MKVVKKTCIGAADVSNLLIFVYENFQIHYRITIGEVNHQPALWYYEGNDLKSCQVFELSPQDGKIIQINSIIDPDKLNRCCLCEYIENWDNRTSEKINIVTFLCFTLSL